MTMKDGEVLAILFDLDNTLIPTRKADEAVCRKLVDILTTAYSVSDDSSVICRRYLETFRNCPDNPELNLDVWRQLLWERALGEAYKHLAGEIYHLWLNLRYDYLRPGTEIKKLLKSLREDYLIGLVTNGPSGAQWEKINRLGLKKYFDSVLVSGDLPWEKPHEKIFLAACDSLGVEPQQCIIVGDKLETDILGGIVSKLRGTVWVPLGSGKLKDDDPVPDFTIGSVMNLPQVLLQMKNVLKSAGKQRSKDGFMFDVEDCNSNGSDGS